MSEDGQNVVVAVLVSDYAVPDTMWKGTVRAIRKFFYHFVRFDKGYSWFIFNYGVPPIVAVKCRYNS